MRSEGPTGFVILPEQSPHFRRRFINVIEAAEFRSLQFESDSVDQRELLLDLE